MFSFLTPSPTRGLLLRCTGKAEAARGQQIVVTEYAKRPESFQRTLGKRIDFLMAEISHFFLPSAPTVPFHSFLIWGLKGVKLHFLWLLRLFCGSLHAALFCFKGLTTDEKIPIATCLRLVEAG